MIRPQPEGGDQLDRRVVDGVVEDRPHVGVAVVAVDGVELLEGGALAAEELQHRHAGDVLLEVGVDARDLHPHPRYIWRARDAEPEGDRGEQRQDAEADQGQPPVEPEEHRDDAAEQHDVAEDRHQPGGEQLVERVDVGGHAGDQAADRVAVEVGERQGLQVAEDLAPQVAHDVLPHQEHQPALLVEDEEGGDQRGEVDGGDGGQPLARRRRPSRRLESLLRPPRRRRELRRVALRANEQVERHGGRQRPDELQQRREDDQQHGDDRGAPVRPHVGDQPPHQVGVVGLAERFLFVDGGGCFRHGRQDISAVGWW
jgi:hypothetical protein